MHLILLHQFIEILSYNQWANQRLLENIQLLSDDDYHKNRPIPFDNIHLLLTHLFYYDQKYFYKIFHPEQKFTQEKMDRTLLAHSLLTSSQQWLLALEKLQNITPESLENAAKKIITVSMHNNYHRGQINLLISLLGYNPQSLDVFVYSPVGAENFPPLYGHKDH